MASFRTRTGFAKMTLAGGFQDIARWHPLFPAAPYGDMYDAPATPISCFVLPTGG